MNILLDTHILIWALTNNLLLSDKAKEIIINENNEIYYSIVSLWKIEIKHINNPKNLTLSSKIVADVAELSGYNLLPLNLRSIYKLQDLKRSDFAPRHKNPFDKILICQSIIGDMVFLTHDHLIVDYNIPNVLLV